MDLYKPYTFTIIPGCFSCQLLNCLSTDMQYLFDCSFIEGHIFFENKASSKLVKVLFAKLCLKFNYSQSIIIQCDALFQYASKVFQLTY